MSNEAYNRQVIAKKAAEGVLELAQEALAQAKTNIAANKKLKEIARLAADSKKQNETQYFSKQALKQHDSNMMSIGDPCFKRNMRRFHGLKSASTLHSRSSRSSVRLPPRSNANKLDAFI